MTPHGRWCRRPRVARAFTLIEAIGSVLIVAVMFVAVMSTVGAARMSQYKMSGRSRGTALAQDLMAEILQAPYEDPDGPSAGITMVTGIASKLTGRKVKADVAMTGEVTAVGEVHPIGGLKEKSMAAFRASLTGPHSGPACG